MSNFIDNLYGTLVNPKKTLALLAARRQAGQGVLAFLLANLFSSLAALLGEDLGGSTANLDLGGALPAIFGIAFLLTAVFWLVGLGVLHLLAELLGGEGSIKSLLATQGFAQVPAIFVVPFAFLGILIGDWLTITASLALGLWTLILSVLSVKFSYGLSTGRSVLTVLLPGIVALLVMLIIVVLVLAAIWPLLSQMMHGLL